MPVPVQNIGDSQALVEAFGLKGTLTLAVDETAVPVVPLFALDNSPYTTIIPVGFNLRQAGVAGNNSFVGARAGENLILEIKVIDIENETAGILDYEVRTMSAANFTTGTVNAVGGALHLNNEFVGGALARTPSESVRGQHTALLGTVVWRVSIPAQSNYRCEFPHGLYLYGDDPAGPNGIVVWNVTQNSPVAPQLFGREFRTKG